MDDVSFCGSCGNRLGPTEAFCGQCGTPNADTASAPPPVAATEPIPVVASTASVPADRRWPWLLGAASFVAILCIGAAILFVVARGDDSSTNAVPLTTRPDSGQPTASSLEGNGGGGCDGVVAGFEHGERTSDD